MKFTRFALMGLLLLLLLPLGCARQDPKLEAENRMKRMGLLMLLFINEGDALVYPDFSSPEATRQSLQPMLAKQDAQAEPKWNDDIFTHPSSGKLWVPNARLSKISVAAVTLSNQTIAFYAPAPDGDNRLVGFADGHIKWVPESEWPAAKPAGGA